MSEQYSQSLDEMEEFLNILYYGDPGSGKTSAAASMAHLGIVYLVDVESGAKARPLRKLGIPVENIRPVKVGSYQDLDRFYWFLKQELEDAKPGSIAGVVFDSISEIHDQLIRAQVDVRHGKAVRKVTNRQGEMVQDVDDNEFMVELSDRGIVTEQLRTLTRRFRDLPCHTAWVALAKREVESDGVVYLPQLPPKFGGQLRGFVDIVGFMTKVPDIDIDDASGYLGVFRDTGKHKGKDRLGALPPVMANPALHRIMAVIFDEIDLGTDPAHAAYLARVRSVLAPDPAPEDARLDTESDTA